jgi:ferritin-like metal-binding protein YciE
MANAENLEDALLAALKDIYNAEKQIVQALPKMAAKASHPDLRAAFERHAWESQRQIDRLDEISEILGQTLTGKVCKSIKALIEEGNKVLGEFGDNEYVIDSMLISAARRVEHFEIAAYCSAMAIAEGLELSRIFLLLRENFAEESKTDSALKILAKKFIIPLALDLEIELSANTKLQATA